MTLARRADPNFKVLGVRVDAVQIPGVIERIQQWIGSDRKCHFVAVTGMHGVMEARHDPLFKAILNSADLVVPDGMPLVWLGRLRGYHLRRRVYGPDLMFCCFEMASRMGYRHYFYGGSAGVPEKLATTARGAFPNLNVVGLNSPPFRPLTASEDEEIIARINACSPEILWVGLSTPKQERWMYEHRSRLCVPVVIGVGAAFDFHAGVKRQAPAWMREHGLEWLFRLLQEPHRLWRRYLVYGSQFLFWAALEQLGLRKFD